MRLKFLPSNRDVYVKVYFFQGCVPPMEYILLRNVNVTDTRIHVTAADVGVLMVLAPPTVKLWLKE